MRKNETVRTPMPTRVSGGIPMLEGMRIIFGKAIEVAESTKLYLSLKEE